jgi:hypothetical protein
LSGISHFVVYPPSFIRLSFDILPNPLAVRYLFLPDDKSDFCFVGFSSLSKTVLRETLENPIVVAFFSLLFNR